ncbi:MAG TPA: PEP-CTERM sorting domain-containing protein [Luteolibacter sp.]|nr:PEP-CTERM sorting domain-containing protein [Luteolibacter sp.]
MKPFVFLLPVVLPLPAQAVSYFENFGSYADGTYLASTEGWTAFYSNSGATSNNLATALPNGSGTSRGGIADGASWAAADGYLFAQNTAGAPATDFFLHTTPPPLANSTFASFVPASPSTTVSWNSNNGSFGSAANGAYYFAVQVNSGSWYAVTTNYVATSSPSFNLNLANFYAISFAGAGAAMSINTGSTVTFASLFGSGEEVTGIGFYVDDMAADARTLRIDNLRIIPEPGSLALTGLSVAGLILRRRR